MQIGAVGSKGVVSHAEAAGACSTESVADGFQWCHAADEQQHDVQHRHAHINQVENRGGGAHFRHQLTHIGAGAFCPEQVHGKTLAVATGKGQQEHQYAHTAQPMAEAAPVKDTGREGFHIRKNGRACGGKAGYDLKQGIHKPGNFPGDPEGQTAHQTHGDPADTHADKTLFGMEGAGGAPADQSQHQHQHSNDAHGNEKAHGGCGRSAAQADHQRRDHKKSFNGQDLGDKTPHHFIVHRDPSQAKISSNRRRMPRPLVTTTRVSPSWNWELPLGISV